ncbi:6,7-dimethyl-8-ribityllumazine synthase [Desulfocurvus sp. DL9XJH121]
MTQVKTIEGKYDAQGLSIAIVACRFNDFIVDRLVGGAVDYLCRNGAAKENLTLVRIPGAFEMPLAARKLAAGGKYDAVICLGAVIRGATPHFDFVSSESAKGIAQAMLDTGVPIGFGLLTTDTLEQAIERAGSKAGNKGVEAASAALEMVRVMEQI